MTPALLYALQDPARRQILRLLGKEGVEQSPIEMMQVSTFSMSAASYHVRTLSKLRVIRLTRTGKVRGATQHFYASNVATNDLVAAILQETEEDDRFLGESEDPRR